VNRPQEGTCDIGSFERDTTPPDAPVITSPAEGSLNPGSFTISGTAEAGAKVELFEGTVSNDEARANSSGAWSIDLTGVTPDGKHSYTAKATDVGGNVSGASGTRTVRVDATAPAAPLIDSPAEGSLNPSSFSVTGRAEANSTVELFEGTTSIGTDTSDGVGAWSIALSGVSDGSHSYTAKAIDSVGNTSAASRARSITVDAKAPLAPVITYPAQGTRLNYRSFSLSGTAEAGAKVELFEGALSKGTATADTYGKWKIALSGVSEGSHSYTAKATDASGNTSAPSSIRTVIVDTTKPKVTSVDPAENATAVVPDANIYVTFSEAMKATTINTTTFKLFKEGSTTAITASVSYDPISKKATLNPYPYSHERLEPEVTYKAVVTTGAKDLAGNALDQNPTLTGNQNKVWFFKVVFDPSDQ
jgi:hypothetical protein